jgi:hypothetical protein
VNAFKGAPPAFLPKNYLNRHANNAGDLSVSSGDATKHRLFDMVPTSRWQSQGSSDLVTETAEFGLWTPGARASHDVYNVLVQNHNLEGLTIESSNTNGAPWTQLFSKSDLAEKYTWVPVQGQAADRMKFSMTTTQTADEEKKVGGIVVTGAAFQPKNFFDYKPEPPRVRHKSAVMHDGSLRSQAIWRADDGASFWAAKCVWLLDPEDYDPETDDFQDDLDTFREYGLKARQFIFIPAPGDRKGEVFLCRVRPGTFNDEYIRKSENPGGKVAVQMVIEEIGGA